MNVSDIIKRHVMENPEKTAIIFEERRISYKELDDLINRAANGLTNLGLKQGDVLSLFLPSLPATYRPYVRNLCAVLLFQRVFTVSLRTDVQRLLFDTNPTQRAPYLTNQ